jgi:hypothetical protein
VTITVPVSNSCPTFDNTPVDESVNQGRSLTLTDFCSSTDADGDTVTCTLKDENALECANDVDYCSSSGSDLTFAPSNVETAGDTVWTATLDDGTCDTTTASFTLSIVELSNSPPVIDPDHTDYSCGINESCSLTHPTFTDIDGGDTHIWTYSSTPLLPNTDCIAFSQSAFNMACTSNANEAGDYSIMLTVSDDNSLGAANGASTDSNSFVISITEQANAQPMWDTTFSEQDAYIGTVRTITFPDFTDTDSGDTHTYSISPTESFLTID